MYDCGLVRVSVKQGKHRGETGVLIGKHGSKDGHRVTASDCAAVKLRHHSISSRDRDSDTADASDVLIISLDDIGDLSSQHAPS